MRIVCAGGGPAGLYFAIQMKRRDPSHRITVIERNRADDTFGWGVVFSDETLRNLEGADPASKQEILDSFAHWDDIDIHFKGRVITSGGHGFCGIERRHLLNILQRRAAGLGVELVFQREANELAEFADADLIVAADGINSRIRGHYAAHFKPTIDVRRNKFVWLGTHRMFEAFTFIFVETEYGWFQAHAYRFNHDTSTFIVETTEANWRSAGLDQLDASGTTDFCERLFAPWLEGHRLLTNMSHLRGSQWLSFPRVANESWVMGNVVLMGDAAHSAHFSIGSGTKLALEDAIALARAFDRHGTDVPAALAAYEAERKIEVLRIQSAARNSTEWFENVARYATLDPEQFAYSLLTRSQRISHENLRLRDRPWLEGMERWLAERAGHPAHRPVPPMFLPFRLREMRLANRIVVSPMATYSARDGMPNDFHLVHLGARALGGAGLVFTEMVCVTRQGRITPGCAGLWSDEQMRAWSRIVDFVHANSDAKICLQLGHSGLKGSTQVGWEDMDAAAAGGELGADRAFADCLERAQSDPTPDDTRRHGRGARRLRERGAIRRARRLRHAGAARRARVSALFLHIAADQPARRQLRRIAGEPVALPAGGVRRHARGVAGGQADVGPHLGDRLGGGRHHRRRCGGDRPQLQGRQVSI